MNNGHLIQRFFIRLFHWEYWPFHAVYTPIYFYWFWLCIKARSFFFFNTANPTIRNGGFLMERKHEIYDLMPQEFYPLTVLCAAHSNDKIQLELARQKGLDFPMIAKPDIGMRGLSVQLLQNAEELKAYSAKSPVDFLLQQFVSFTAEAGIFYYRFPGEKSGHISGIVGKEFLTVTGDGNATIKELLLANDRFVLQLPALQQSMGNDLMTILPKSKSLTLVPYGNHSRGAMFLDWSEKINDELVEMVNGICKKIPEFYFGRLDIKFNTWEELNKGINFSIIEVNGAGSEPTHMYDPKHTIFFAWKEIIRHWNILYRISKLNRKKKGLNYMTLRDGLAMLNENKQQVKLISLVN